MTRARRWAAAHVDLPRVAAALAELTGARVDVVFRDARSPARADPADAAVGVLLAPAGAGPAAGALLEASAPLAAALVARALRRPPPALVSVTASVPASVAGALAAVVLAAARRAGGDGLRLAGAGPSAALAPELGRSGSPAVELSLSVRLDGEAFAARVVLPGDASGPLAGCDAGAWPWSAARLAALGPTPLAVPVVASSCRATVADVASLDRGDVFLPGGWRLAPAKGGGWSGRALLAPPSASAGASVEVSGDGGLVLIGDLEPVDASEAHMEGGGEKDALVTAMGEVPVLVRVEVGEATLPAREWAALGRGDVIALGRRIGEKVVLRVGGVAVARGELVDVDGEIGVRIAERTSG